MHGIVSLLDHSHTEEVESLWRDLDIRCGLTGIQVTPVPHFSWQIAEKYDINRLEPVLSQIARETRPFSVRAAGLGLFSGENPVLYIALVKDAALLHFHEIIWEQTQAIGYEIHPLYSPALWMPHITLAHGDVNGNNLGCALQNLAYKGFRWEIQVDRLAIISQADDQVGMINIQFPFRG